MANRPAPNPAQCQFASAAIPAMNAGAAAHPRLPLKPCAENA